MVRAPDDNALTSAPSTSVGVNDAAEPATVPRHFGNHHQRGRSAARAQIRRRSLSFVC